MYQTLRGMHVKANEGVRHHFRGAYACCRIDAHISFILMRMWAVNGACIAVARMRTLAMGAQAARAIKGCGVKSGEGRMGALAAKIADGAMPMPEMARNILNKAQGWPASTIGVR